MFAARIIFVHVHVGVICTLKCKQNELMEHFYYIVLPGAPVGGGKETATGESGAGSAGATGSCATESCQISRAAPTTYDSCR